MPSPGTSPYGTWHSRLPADALAAGAVALGDLVAGGGLLAWTEQRPAEGRQAPVAWDAAAGVRDLGPADFSARTLVHEYGGAPLVVGPDGTVLATDWDQQRLHRLDGSSAEAITAAPPTPRTHRYADGSTSPDGRWLVCVREDHTGEGGPRNELVGVDLADGEVRLLVAGRDFVAAPRLSPDGRRLAWLAWDHPWMPWDAAELWVADVDDGRVVDARHVGGGPGDAAVSPTWTRNGRLVASFDGSGFWEVHVAEDGGLRPLTSFGADVGFPAWSLGNQVIAELADGRLACVVTERGEDRIELLAPDGTTERLDVPHVAVTDLVSHGEGLAWIGHRPDGDAAVVRWDPVDGLAVVREVTLPLAPGDRARAEHVEVDLPDGGATHAWLYPPTSQDVVGPDDERPPLVVFVHGGPTAHRPPVLSLGIAWFTTRGFAVADLNYRGSTGHGRAYRDLLRGSWGVLDVEDAMAVATALAERGRVDGERMVIRGGSAGGFTTLAVLTAPEHPFAAGTSFFGVADLLALAQHTHKFESRYLDQVVGPLPEARERYVERSPLTHADRLSRPLLVLQGLEDEVVPPAQAEAIVAAAAERGVPHAYVAFEGEQHGFRKAENIVTWLESELSFYGQVLGFTPAGDLRRVRLSGG